MEMRRKRVPPESEFVTESVFVNSLKNSAFLLLLSPAFSFPVPCFRVLISMPRLIVKSTSRFSFFSAKTSALRFVVSLLSSSSLLSLVFARSAVLLSHFRFFSVVFQPMKNTRLKLSPLTSMLQNSSNRFKLSLTSPLNNRD